MRDEKCILFFFEKPEGKSPLGRLRCRLEDNIRMDLTEIMGRCGLHASGSE
jgi:hypothetical protein